MTLTRHHSSSMHWHINELTSVFNSSFESINESKTNEMIKLSLKDQKSKKKRFLQIYHDINDTVIWKRIKFKKNLKVVSIVILTSHDKLCNSSIFIKYLTSVLN